MSPHGTLSLSSFDSTQRAQTQVSRPETYRSLLELIASENVAIARGAGLSYTPASFAKDAVSIDLTRFDRILSFDPITGLVDVEPGVKIGALASFLADRGRYLPAMPGYPSITIGGCMAFDIHGKSQFHSGNFAEWVESFDLQHRDHGSLPCSRQQNADIFALTLGGAGLTGVITAARLRTTALPGPSVEVSAVPVSNLLHSAQVLMEKAETAACLYSWNNLNRRGESFGAGVVYVERFVDQVIVQAEAKPSMDLRTRLPMRGWNRASTSLSMAAYGFLQGRAQPRVLGLHAALFPLRGKEHYFAAFGPSGFREYQLIVPLERWESFVVALERLIATSKLPITLGSLKLFKGAPTLLRFSGSGICLAIDVPASPRASALFAEIDVLAMAHGAVLNLSKDSRLSADVCERTFPGYSRFRDDLSRFDDKRRYQSQLSKQIGL